MKLNGLPAITGIFFSLFSCLGGLFLDSEPNRTWLVTVVVVVVVVLVVVVLGVVIVGAEVVVVVVVVVVPLVVVLGVVLGDSASVGSWVEGLLLVVGSVIGIGLIDDIDDGVGEVPSVARLEVDVEVLSVMGILGTMMSPAVELLGNWFPASGAMEELSLNDVTMSDGFKDKIKQIN